MFLQFLHIMINDLLAIICNLLEKTGVCNGILAYKDYYTQKLIPSKCINEGNPKRVTLPESIHKFSARKCIAHYRIILVYL